MINDAQVYLAGHVASPPSFKIVGGRSSATVRVAFTPRWLNRETGEWSDGPTSFVNVLCWRTLADNVAMCLRKGEPVLVMGRLRVRRYQDKEGAVRTAVEVEALSVGHDLTRGVAAFSRTRRAAGPAADEMAGSAGQDAGPAAGGSGAGGEVKAADGAVPPAGGSGSGGQDPAARGAEPGAGGSGSGDRQGAPASGVVEAVAGTPPAMGTDGEESGDGPDGPAPEESLDDAVVAELTRQLAEPAGGIPPTF